MSSQGFGVPPYIQSNNVSSGYSLNGELPPEIAVKEQALNRRQQIANLMLQNSMKPLQGGMAGRRFYVPPSWTQGLANLGEALGGVYINHGVDKDRAALGEENQRYTADAIQQWQKAREGTAAQPGQPTEVQAQGPPRPELVNALASQNGTGDAGTSGKLPDMSAPVKIAGAYPTASVMGPGTPAIPATQEQRQAADMALLSKRVPGSQFMVQQAQHTADLQAQRAFQEKEHALTREQTDIQKDADRKNAITIASGKIDQMLLMGNLNNDMKKYLTESQADLRKELQQMEDKRAERHDSVTAKQHDLDRQNALTIAKLGNQTKENVAATKQGDGVKLKPGERMREDGTVEAIKGSDLYQKQSGAHAKDYGALQTMNTKTDMALKKIDEVLDKNNEGAFNSNFGGYNALLTQRLPGAQDMRNKIESIKSDLKTAGLEIIRSGGGIGQMTEREWPIVEKMIDNVDPTLSEPAARDIFAKIKAYLGKIRDNVQSTYDTEWNNSQFYKGGTKQGSPSGGPSVESLLEKYK